MTDLEKIARGLLQSASPQQALPRFVKLLRKRNDLLNALALDYLENLIAADLKTDDTQASSVGDENGVGHADDDTQLVSADSVPPKIKVPAYKVPPHQRRTHEQVEAEKRARLLMADAIFDARMIGDRPIGNIKYGELLTLRQEYVANAASWLRQGTEATATAILIDKLAKHAQLDDPMRLVREFVTPRILKKMILESEAEAPRVVERGMHAYARVVEQYEEMHEMTHG